MNPLKNEPERKKQAALLTMVQGVRYKDRPAFYIGAQMFKDGERLEQQLKNTTRGIHDKH